MGNIAYHFRIRVTNPDKKQSEESMTVSESPTRFGESIALGKVVRYYEGLRESKKILDYRILT